MDVHSQAGSDRVLKSASPYLPLLPWGESSLEQSPVQERQPGEGGAWEGCLTTANDHRAFFFQLWSLPPGAQATAEVAACA